MANNILEIRDFSVFVNKKELVKRIELEVSKSEVHLLLGANGSGKSTLLKSLAFDNYDIRGSAELFGQSLEALSTVERARMGVFLSHQEPTVVPGVPILDFLRLSYNEIHSDKPLDPWTFKEYFDAYADQVGLPLNYAYRNLNEGFSGGEKKKLELLQLLLLKPKLALIDEIDSGLDYASLELIFKIIDDVNKTEKMAMIIVSHNKNICDYIKPTKVHIIDKGSLIASGDENVISSL